MIALLYWRELCGPLCRMYGPLCPLLGSLCSPLCGRLCGNERSVVPIDRLGVLNVWLLVLIARFVVQWAANPCPVRTSAKCRVLLCGALCPLCGPMCRRGQRHLNLWNYTQAYCMVVCAAARHRSPHEGSLLYGPLCPAGLKGALPLLLLLQTAPADASLAQTTTQ